MQRDLAHMPTVAGIVQAHTRARNSIRVSHVNGRNLGSEPVPVASQGAVQWDTESEVQ